jgi:ATPase subunit of ABC transporter with duplicated ATPase domains
MSGPQFIYHMHRLSKIVPPKREILKNINLSFYPGAKIGVVGSNGSGKSSLLKIMAGLDTDFLGEAWAAKGTRIGYLAPFAAMSNSPSPKRATCSPASRK